MIVARNNLCFLSILKENRCIFTCTKVLFEIIYKKLFKIKQDCSRLYFITVKIVLLPTLFLSHQFSPPFIKFLPYLRISIKNECLATNKISNFYL